MRNDVNRWLKKWFEQYPNAAYRETVFDLMAQFDMPKQAARDYVNEFCDLCPLHKAAPEMLEMLRLLAALEALVRNQDTGFPYAAALNNARDLLQESRQEKLK